MQHSVRRFLHHLKVHVGNMSMFSLNHNISSHIGQNVCTRGKTRIMVEIFKTLLQALTSIQYELFMVCSPLGSLSLSFNCDTYIPVIFSISIGVDFF